MSTSESDRPDDDHPGDDDSLAAELALGVLPLADHAELERRADLDPAFAARVAAWHDRLLPLAHAFSEAAPAASVKAGLDRRLFGDGGGRAGGWWQSLGLWRGLAGAATLALLLALALPWLNPAPPAPAPRMVASLADGSSDVHYVVVYDRSRQEVGLSHVSGLPPEGQRFELWVIRGETPPMSLGTIPTGAAVHMAVDDAAGAMVEPGALLAISLEPMDEPPGQPTVGPIVATGDLRDL